MLSSSLRALFEVEVEVEALTDFERAEPLHPREALQVQKAVAKRQREFAAGRTCARRALARAGAQGELALPSLPDRRVDWPEGFVGSLSHAREVAAAVVASRARAESLGLDVEELGRIGENLYGQIADAEEIAWIRAGGASAGDRATQLFSAKEAFYKAQYPLTETFLGFHDVRYEPRGRGFVIEVRAAVPQLAARGGVFPGRLWLQGGYAWAGVTFLPR